MKMTIKHENDDFLGITLKHVPGLKVALNSPRTIKLWAITHQNDHKTLKTASFWSYLSNARTASFWSYLSNMSGRKVTVNRPRTPKLWALAHENGHKTRERRVSGHISQTCQGSFETCKSG